jgi:hypothetical protein
MPTAATQLLTIDIDITQAARTSAFLGYFCILTSDTLGGGGAGTYQAFTSAQDVAAALAASQIGSTTATNLLAALGQDEQPARVYVITYGSGVPSDALDLAIAAGLDVGVFMLQSTAEAAQELLGVWLAADNARKSRYVFVVQSADTGLYGSGKPASLDDCELFGVRMIYSADAQPTAAAFGGRLAAANLQRGPTISTYRLLGVDPTAATSAQITDLNTNDVGYVLNLDAGSDSSQRRIMGTRSYDGSDFGGAVSLIYAARQLRAVLLAWWLDLSARGEPLPADMRGRASAEAKAQEVLGPLGAVGYWSASASLPVGYSITSAIGTNNDGDAIIELFITCQIARQVVSIGVNIQGIEV